jgi:hypothetical protein
MSPLDVAKLFREKADVYLDMTAHVSDERHRRILHELFEENEARADLLERMVYSDAVSEAYRGSLCSTCCGSRWNLRIGGFPAHASLPAANHSCDWRAVCLPRYSRFGGISVATGIDFESTPRR